jgi:cryptochrome 1
VQVITYIWAKEEEDQFQPGRASRWWLYNSLKALETQIRAKGSYICYRRGPSAVEHLLEICKDVKSTLVFFNNVYDPLSLVRHYEVKRRLAAAGVVARSFNGELLYEPWQVLADDGKPFTTFRTFWTKCEHQSDLLGCYLSRIACPCCRIIAFVELVLVPMRLPSY